MRKQQNREIIYISFGLTRRTILNVSKNDYGFAITKKGQVFRVPKYSYPKRSMTDVFCDSWTPPEDLDLTPPAPSGLKGKMSDLLRMKIYFDRAISKIRQEG